MLGPRSVSAFPLRLRRSVAANVVSRSHIVFHEQNAAQLAICDGILSGARTTQCDGASATTAGARGSARFTLAARRPGAGINVSKVRWEECVRAARLKCPTGSLSGVCLRAATAGHADFRLDTTM